MNLRQVACIVVLLACTLATVSAPVIHTFSAGGQSGHKTLFLRSVLGDASHAATLDLASFDRRTEDAKSKPARKTPTTKASGDPGRKKPHSQSTNLGSKTRPVKNRPSKSPASKPPKTSGRQCAIRPKGKNNKREPFDIQAECGEQVWLSYNYFCCQCDCAAELTLGTTTRGIQKVSAQGNSAITYRVQGNGWPDASNMDVVAYAKTGPGNRPKLSFADEIKWLNKTDQLLAQGLFAERTWIVFRGVDGKVDIQQTDHFKTTLAPQLGRGNTAPCVTWVTDKIDLVILAVKYYVERYGVRHRDVHPGNILWDKDAKKTYLIDWGLAVEVPTKEWTHELEQSVRDQVTRSYLQGDNNICQSYV